MSFNDANSLSKIAMDQGPQLWFSAPAGFGANVQATQPANLSLPSLGVQVIWRGRITVATTAYSTLNCEAPQNILQNITVNGKRARVGSATVYDGSGASLFLDDSAMEQLGGHLRINSVLIPRLTSPVGLAVGTTSGTFGGIGTFDVEVEYYVPFAPFGSSNAIQTLYSQRDSDWNRTMNFTASIGTSASFGTGAGTVTATAYGSATGSPTVYVYLIPTLQNGNGYNLLSQYQAGFCQRTPVAFSLATAGSNTQIRQLDSQYDTSRIYTKAGVIDSNGDYVSLSDDIVSQFFLTRGNKPLVQFNDTFSQKRHAERKNNTILPQGLNLIDFVGSHSKSQPAAALQATNAATQLVLSGNWTATSNGQLEILQEEILENPKF